MSPTAWPTPQRSRDRVLSALRSARTPVGVSELVEATGLSANGVRFHLRQLMSTGQVTAAPQAAHTGPGRPAIRYSPVPLAPADPSAPYRVLAAVLTSALERSGSATAAVDAGRLWARSMRDGLGPDAADHDPVGVVREVFAAAGFDPRPGPERRTLALHRCPFLDLARRAPDVVCGVHQGLAAGLLQQAGAPYEVDLVPVLDGPGPCLVRLTVASSSHPPTEEHAP